MSDAAPFNLQDLQADLRAQLQVAYFPTDPIQVRCVFKEGICIILVQHSAPALEDKRSVFRLIRDYLPQNLLREQYKILSYLRITGAAEPYAFHTFAPPDHWQDPEATLSTESPDFTLSEEAAFTPTEALGTFPGIDLAADELPPEAAEPPTFSTDDVPEEDLTAPVVPPGDRPQKKSLVALGIGGLVLVLAGVAGYVLTRPCVLGSCPPLNTASQLADPAQAIFTTPEPPSGQAILQAQTDLQQAIANLDDLLGTVPQWSPRYPEIKAQRAEYQTLSNSLGQLISGLSQAAKAAQMAEQADLSPVQWQEVAQQWQGAITTLEAIPAEDFYHDFAQEKLAGYRQNLNVVEQRF
ncbi:MAG: hypothetical protein VKJ86_03795 [Synechococcus sp.]|nr:hypothetical protein [Synechococcus sp.]